MKSQLNRLLSNLKQRRCRKEPVLEIENASAEEKEQEQYVSTKFLQTQKNNLLIYRITGKNIATFFQSLASTSQYTTLI